MKYEIGQSATISKTITETDVVHFAKISGDFNPIHISVEVAENSIFKKRICHGALISSFISTVLGMYMPGPGTIYLMQESRFVAPVYIDDTITVVCEIISIDENGKSEINTYVKNQKGEIVVQGKALVLLPRK